MTARIDTVVADAIARLATQFQGKPAMRAFLEALLAPFQDLETAFYALLVERQIGTATGITLDVLGDLVGQARGGASDDDYRRLIRARIATNRSSGLASDLIRIMRLVLDDLDARVIVQRRGTASVLVRVAGAAVTASVADIGIVFLRAAKAAGVRLTLESATGAPAAMFTLAVGDGLGFGTAARLNLAGVTGSCDTVIRSRTVGANMDPDDDGVSLSMSFVHDAGAPNTGALSSAGDLWTFTFKGGTTTVQDFESAITAGTAFSVFAAGSVATLIAGGDEFAGALFTGGVDGGIWAGVRE